jgi:hypothetical protein
MGLLDDGWTEEQAKGLLDCLDLKDGVPDWKPVQLQKLRDWCSAQEKDPYTIEASLSSSRMSFATPMKASAWL